MANDISAITKYDEPEKCSVFPQQIGNFDFNVNKNFLFERTHNPLHYSYCIPNISKEKIIDKFSLNQFNDQTERSELKTSPRYYEDSSDTQLLQQQEHNKKLNNNVLTSNKSYNNSLSPNKEKQCITKHPYMVVAKIQPNEQLITETEGKRNEKVCLKDSTCCLYYKSNDNPSLDTTGTLCNCFECARSMVACSCNKCLDILVNSLPNCGEAVIRNNHVFIVFNAEPCMNQEKPVTSFSVLKNKSSRTRLHKKNQTKTRTSMITRTPSTMLSTSEKADNDKPNINTADESDNGSSTKSQCVVTTAHPLKIVEKKLPKQNASTAASKKHFQACSSVTTKKLTKCDYYHTQNLDKHSINTNGTVLTGTPSSSYNTIISKAKQNNVERSNNSQCDLHSYANERQQECTTDANELNIKEAEDNNDLNRYIRENAASRDIYTPFTLLTSCPSNKTTATSISSKKTDFHSLSVVRRAYKKLLQAVSPNSLDEEVYKNTPARAAKALFEICEGYTQDAKAIVRSALFPAPVPHQLVVVRHLRFESLCEHHLLPFFGECNIAYATGRHVLGLSKFGRLVKAISHKLQIQERLTVEIGKTLESVLESHGILIQIIASLRGLRDWGSSTTTLYASGVLSTDIEMQKVALLQFSQNGSYY